MKVEMAYDMVNVVVVVEVKKITTEETTLVEVE